MAPSVPAPASGALVFGGAHGALALVRSLGRRGIPVWVLTHDHLIAKFSRYVRRSLPWPGPEQAGATEWLVQLAERHRLQGWILFPGGDAEAELVSRNHARLSSTFRLTNPPWEIARWAYDKRLTNERAAALGIAFPWTYYPRNSEEVAKLECRFPVILKPTKRTVVNDFTLAKAWRIDDRAALIARYDQAAALVGADAVMVQELIPGDGSRQFSYAALWQKGAPVASLTARRTRQYPVDFGYTSTFVETMEQREVEAAAEKFLQSIGYSGLAEAEFKYDERDRRYKILDVNARTWTWIAIGERAGIDFPYLAWRIANGEAAPPIAPGTDAAWIHVSRDLLAVGHALLAGRLSPADYVRSLRKPLAFAAFAKDDPLPAVVDLPLAFTRLLLRRVPVMAREWRRKRF